MGSAERIAKKISLLFVVISVARCNRYFCRDPPNLPRLATDLLNETVAILPSEEGPILEAHNSIDDSFIDITRLNTSTQQQFATHSCSVKSTCPWHYVRNFDPNRRPKTLIEAKCSTSCCARSTHTCCSLNDGPGCSRCQPIHYYVHVLRRTGCDVRTRTYIYETKLERVVAGCTCIRIPDAFRPQVPTIPD